MKKIFFQIVLLLGVFLIHPTLHAQSTFSKYLTNTLPNTSFEVARALNNQNGYLLLADRYTNQRFTYVVKTDAALQPVWTRQIHFPQGPTPFDNTTFYDIGELPSHNYYLFGEAADPSQGKVWYVLFVLDTNGIILHQNVLRETNHAANGANIPQLHIGIDSSLVLATSEYEWIGFYRFDRQLNLLSSGFYQLALNSNSYGNDCIMLSDSNLLLTGAYSGGAFTLTKTTRQGNVIWSKGNNGLGRIFSLHEAADKSIYAGGSNGLPFLAHLDSLGNLLWCREYNTTPIINGSAVYGIYPMTNGNLLVYSDSVMFEADTAGFPVNSGYAQPKYNYGQLRPANSDFTLCGLFYQDSTSNYMPTIIRFHTLTQSGCMFPRTLTTNSPTSSTLNPIPLTMTQNIFQQNIIVSDSLIAFGYDALPGCPFDPVGITEYENVNPDFSVFPNPTTNLISFQSTGKKLFVEIFDISGSMVISKMPEQTANNTFSIPLNGLSPGIYALRVYANGQLQGHSIFCVQGEH